MHMRKATCSLDLRRATPQAVVDSGALDSLVTCLEEFDPGVKVRVYAVQTAHAGLICMRMQCLHAHA